MSAELVGRSAQMRAIALLLKQSRTGKPCWLQAMGEPGIGKTRLLSQIAEMGEASGFLVLNGRGSEHSGGLPFGVFVDALDDYLGGLRPDRLQALAKNGVADLAGVFPLLNDGLGEDLAVG